MSNRSTDIVAFGQTRRRNRAALTGEAALAEKRQRAALTEKRLPQVPAGALPGLSGANSTTTRLLTEDERRRAASYSIPERELKARTADALRAEISEPIKEMAQRLRLNLIATRCLQAVYDRQKAAGGGWTQLSAADIAETLNSHPLQGGANAITPDHVRDLIAALTKLGALDQKPGFGPGVQPQFKVPV
jgi:hypothetical protein